MVVVEPDKKQPGTIPVAASSKAAPAKQFENVSEADLKAALCLSVKPKISYRALTVLAMMRAPRRIANANMICKYIAQVVPYYKKATGWRARVLHQLTQETAFKKLTTDYDKSSNFYGISPDFSTVSLENLKLPDMADSCWTHQVKPYFSLHIMYGQPLN